MYLDTTICHQCKELKLCLSVMRYKPERICMSCLQEQYYKIVKKEDSQ